MLDGRGLVGKGGGRRPAIWLRRLGWGLHGLERRIRPDVLVVVQMGVSRLAAARRRLGLKQFAYKALHNTDTLHIKYYIIRTLCI